MCACPFYNSVESHIAMVVLFNIYGKNNSTALHLQTKIDFTCMYGTHRQTAIGNHDTKSACSMSIFPPLSKNQTWLPFTQSKLRQDVGPRREEEDHQAVPLCPSRGHLPRGEDDALPPYRDPQVPHRHGGPCLHGGCHRIPGRWVPSLAIQPKQELCCCVFVCVFVCFSWNPGVGWQCSEGQQERQNNATTHQVGSS